MLLIFENITNSFGFGSLDRQEGGPIGSNLGRKSQTVEDVPGDDGMVKWLGLWGQTTNGVVGSLKTPWDVSSANQKLSGFEGGISPVKSSCGK
jgi:hypothetical protein